MRVSRRQYSCLILLAAWLCGNAAANAPEAPIAPLATPGQEQAAIWLGQSKGGVPGCGSDIIVDPSFELPIPNDTWNQYSARYGDAICNAACGDDANLGTGWLNFRNDFVDPEFAFAEQTFTMPEGEFAFLLFYIRGSADSVGLVLEVLMDGVSQLTVDGTFTGAYQEYIPIAIDLSDFADGQTHTLRFQAQIDAGATTFIHIDDVCIELVGGTEGEGGECAAVCEEGGLDADGDGLSLACELCALTNPLDADTDGDGMDDGYEVRRGLVPQSGADAPVDLDNDGLTNLEEYFEDSNPLDINDPFTVRFVAQNGVDAPGRGTLGAPFQTIAYAINVTPATAVKPAVIMLEPDFYSESFDLKPFLTVRSRVPLAATVDGTIVGANNSGLRDLVVYSTSNSPLLKIDDVAMTVRNCRFEGDFNSKGSLGTGIRGIELLGANSGGTKISDCVFTGLDVALDVYGGVPSVRTTRIEQWYLTAVHIHDDDKQIDGPQGSLGDVTNPDTGFNEIFNGVDGPAVLYERPNELKCENIFWGTTDPEVIPTIIIGQADFEPFLASAAILPASIFCTVVNGEDNSRITDAVVTVSPSVFAPVRDNLNGVYALGAVPDGLYTLRASAEPFEDVTQQVSVGPGEIESVVLVLGAPGADPGDPECGCGGGKRAPLNPADALVALSALVTMLFAGLMMRRGA